MILRKSLLARYLHLTLVKGQRVSGVPRSPSGVPHRGGGGFELRLHTICVLKRSVFFQKIETNRDLFKNACLPAAKSLSKSSPTASCGIANMASVYGIIK